MIYISGRKTKRLQEGKKERKKEKEKEPTTEESQQDFETRISKEAKVCQR